MTRRAIAVSVGAGVFLLGVLAGGLFSAGGDAPEPGPVRESAGGDAEASPTSSESASDDGADPENLTEVAVDYATASQNWLYLSDEDIDAAVRAIAVPAAADRLSEDAVAELSVARDALSHAAGPVWWFVRPLAVQVETVGEERARVSVWVVTVLSAADVAVPQADWVTLDLELVRVGDRWLLESVTDTPGPTPLGGVRDDPWQPEPFDDALAGFERIGTGQ
jgi:hypothetical protein